jgi:hypothetical protein
LPSRTFGSERKRRTREHIIADLSVNFVERFILRCGWVARRLNPDYGVDLALETFNSAGEVENGWVLFQLKATESIKRLAKKNVISVQLDWRDVVYWLNAREPGILIIYDATQDCAWWLHLQEALRHSLESRRRAFTLTLHVPLENRLDEAAIRQYARIRDDAQPTS